MFQPRLPGSQTPVTMTVVMLETHTVPLLPGLHVRSTAGTGLVHTEPHHGQDDFRVGLAQGLVKVGGINTNHRTNEL